MEKAIKFSIENKQFVRALETFVSEERWRPVCARIRAGEPFPLPRKSIISKLSTQKKKAKREELKSKKFLDVPGRTPAGCLRSA